MNYLRSRTSRTVLINFATSNRILKKSLCLEDSVANVGETGYLLVSIGNLTSNCQRVQNGTSLGTVVPVILVREAIPQSADEHGPSSPPSTCEHETDRTEHNNFICKVYDEMNIDTTSKYSSSSEI